MGHAHQRERREHEDAHAAAEVAAVRRDEELNESAERERQCAPVRACFESRGPSVNTADAANMRSGRIFVKV